MRTFVHWFVCVIACLNGAMAHAVELVGQPQTSTTADAATIQWRTDVECGTRVQFGQKPEMLDRKAEGAVTSNHSIRLEGLSPGTRYYFSVGSARVRLGSGSFTTAGGAAGAAAPQPSLLRRVLNVITPDQKKETPAAGPAGVTVPPTRKTWGHMDSLQDHFDRHGGDFGSKSADDYAAKAWLFLQRARTENLPMKLDATDGTLRVFDPATRAFAAYNDKGMTKTFFKPDSPTYWQRQPGGAVKPGDLHFSHR
ncbi:fibronectin type III domain-containing protein [Prosthecobacter sp.]|uniref:fibronectin type III domain-containing protein n=1 Tax=Prosthecobacter sp. TaxID=1965333 RepID=UPI003784F51C